MSLLDDDFHNASVSRGSTASVATSDTTASEGVDIAEACTAMLTAAVDVLRAWQIPASLVALRHVGRGQVAHAWLQHDDEEFQRRALMPPTEDAGAAAPTVAASTAVVAAAENADEQQLSPLELVVRRFTEESAAVLWTCYAHQEAERRTVLRHSIIEWMQRNTDEVSRTTKGGRRYRSSLVVESDEALIRVAELMSRPRSLPVEDTSLPLPEGQESSVEMLCEARSPDPVDASSVLVTKPEHRMFFELWEMVFDFLPFQDLSQCPLIMRRCFQHRDDIVWRRLFDRMFPAVSRPVCGEYRVTVMSFLRLTATSTRHAHPPSLHHFLNQVCPKGVIKMGKNTFQIVESVPLTCTMLRSKVTTTPVAPHTLVALQVQTRLGLVHVWVICRRDEDKMSDTRFRQLMRIDWKGLSSVISETARTRAPAWSHEDDVDHAAAVLASFPVVDEWRD